MPDLTGVCTAYILKLRSVQHPISLTYSNSRLILLSELGILQELGSDSVLDKREPFSKMLQATSVFDCRMVDDRVTDLSVLKHGVSEKFDFSHSCLGLNSAGRTEEPEKINPRLDGCRGHWKCFEVR